MPQKMRTASTFAESTATAGIMLGTGLRPYAGRGKPQPLGATTAEC